MKEVQMLNWPVRTTKQDLLTQLKKQKSNDTRTKHERKTTQEEKTGSCKPCGLLMTRKPINRHDGSTNSVLFINYRFVLIFSL